MFRSAIGLAIATAMLAILVGCAGTQPSAPATATSEPASATTVPATLAPAATASPSGDGQGTVDIEGTISDVQAGDGARLGAVRIEGAKVAGNRYDRAQVTVTKDTRILEKKGDSLAPATFEALEVGETVQATFVGPVMESYPVQATAGEIVILARMPRQ